VSPDRPDFENYISIEKIEEVGSAIHVRAFMYVCIYVCGSLTPFRFTLCRSVRVNIDKEITLSRSVISYLWANLFPVPILSHAYINTYIHTCTLNNS
jgi:hypothetical protein